MEDIEIRKIFKVGNSYAVTIPSSILERIDMKTKYLRIEFDESSKKIMLSQLESTNNQGG